MLDYNHIRTSIVSRLNRHLGMLVILENQTGQTPLYPFVTYKLISPYLPSGQGNYGVEPAPDGVELAKQRDIEQVFSFTVHDTDSDRAYQACFNIIEYFDFLGRDTLREQGIVVVEMTNVQSRDTFLTIEYERRVGVDVRIRVVDQSNMQVDAIEKAEIRGG